MTGAFIPWRLAVAVPMLLALPVFIGLSFLHESPDWLSKKHRFEEMEQSVRFYRRYRVNDSCLTSPGLDSNPCNLSMLTVVLTANCANNLRKIFILRSRNPVLTLLRTSWK